MKKQNMETYIAKLDSCPEDDGPLFESDKVSVEVGAPIWFEIGERECD
jgi:hypothetical protein